MGNYNPDPHVCDSYCYTPSPFAPATPGRLVPVHHGARTADYDEGPGDPPFCTVCGHEIVTWPAEFGSPGEVHADSSLDFQD